MITCWGSVVRRRGNELANDEPRIKNIKRMVIEIM